MQYARGSKIIKCDESSLELLRVEESSINKKSIEVSILNYFLPLRLLAITDSILKSEILKSTHNGYVLDLGLFRIKATQLIKNRKSSLITLHVPGGELETVDPRMFLDKGDYILKARIGCASETSIVLSGNLAEKYIYTYKREIVLERDSDGYAKSSLGLTHGDDHNKHQHLYLNRRVAKRYWSSMENPETNLKEAGRFHNGNTFMVPWFIMHRNQTLEMNIMNKKYTVFEIAYSPFHLHRKNHKGMPWVPP